MKNKTLRDSLIGLLLGVSIMLTCYMLIPKGLLLKIFPDSPLESFIFYTSVVVCPFIALFFHEAGHLLAGLLQQFKLQLFVVTFLGLKREDGKVKFFLNKEWQYFGGVAATSPVKITDDLRKQFAIILIAGPISSLFFGVISIAWLVYTDTMFNSSAALLGIISIGLFLATTLPGKSGIFFTDRKRMQRLLDKGKTGEIELCYVQTASQLLIDHHYKNLSIDRLRLIQSDIEPVVQFWGYYFEYKHSEEMGESEKSALIRQRLLSYQTLIPSTIWKSLSIQ
jgi:hypothetical protein